MKKNVAALVVLDKDKILLLKRGPNSSGSGLWNFPGGSVEKDEEPELAAVRETKEETGLEVGTNEIEYLCDKDTKYLNVDIYITDKFSGEVKINSESSEYKWATLEELSKLPFIGGGTISNEILESIKKFMDSI